MLAEPRQWAPLPETVREWLRIQQWRSLVPGARDLLVETFPRADKHYLVCYPFEGRLAHQTLGMLLTRRLERARLKPLGFVANEYALAVWGLGDVALAHPARRTVARRLFDEDMLGDDLEAWLAESALMKRTFRTCAIIAGLIERRFPGEEKSRRQLTISTDLVYDVLRKHQADHVLLRAARADAATGLLDIRRLGEMLSRIRGRIVHKALDRVSPLAVPVMLEIGRETVYGEASESRDGRSRRGPDQGGDGMTHATAMPQRSPRRPTTSRADDRPSGDDRRCRTRRRSGRRAVLAGAGPAGGRRSASGKGLELCRARRAAAALRHRRDARPACRSSSRATRRAWWSRSATAFTTAAARPACADTDRATLRGLQRGRDWIWIAGNHDPDPPAGHRRRSLATLCARRAAPSATSRRAARTAKSPAICIRWRAWRGAAAP